MTHEEDMIQALQQGTSDALCAIIKEYGGYTYKIVSAILGPSAGPQAVEEAVSDIFVSLWRARFRLDKARPLRPYLAAMARNAAKKALRGTGREEPWESPPESEQTAPSPQALAEEADRALALRQALDSLKTEDKLLFLRFYYMEQSIPQIASATGVNPSTLKSRLARGRETLRRILTERGFDDEL